MVFHNEKMTLHLGNKLIELYYFGKAHTSGDILTYLPDDKVLYSGDVVTETGAPPYAEDGFPASWVNVIESVEELDIQTIVPGHGVVGDKNMAVTEREYLALLRDETRKQYDAGVDVAKAISDITVPGFQSWSEGAMFEMAVDRLYKEFAGTI